MRIYTALFCLVAIASANNVDNYRSLNPIPLDPNAILRQVFEMLRWLVKNGSPDLVPVLDPFEFDHRSFAMNMPNKLFNLNANFTNGIFTGLGDFELLEIKFIKDDIAIHFDINFPLLILTSEQYEMEGNIYEAIPLAGYGTFEFEASNFKLWTTIYLKQSEDGQSILIDRFQDSGLSVEKILSRAEFDGAIDDIFNAMIEDLLADNINRFSKSIIMKYSDSVIQTLNPILNQYETWNFLEAILS